MKKIKVLAILLSIVFFVSTVGLAATPSTLKRNYWNAKQYFKQGIDVTGGDILLNGSDITNKVSNVWYVYSGTGADTLGNDYGKTWQKPFATVDYAINQSSAGDIIYVLQAHAESYTAANGFDADVAGISIVGIGEGSRMPTFTFADTDATVAIGAAGVTLHNLRFLAGISEVVMGVSVEAAGDYAMLDGLVFPEPSGSSLYEFDKAILLATGADNVTIQNCIAYNADTTGATNFIDLDTGVQNGTRIINNYIHGEYAEGAIHSDDVDLDVFVWGNQIYNLTSGQHCIEFTDAAIGSWGNNYCYTDAEATSYDPGSLKAIAPNWVVTAVDASPVPFPALDDTAENLIGVNDADNAAVTSTVAANRDGSILERLEHVLDVLVDDEATNLVGYADADNAADTTTIVANEDGSVLERLEQIQEAINKGAGTAIGSGKSIVDLLGTTGAALVDDALSVVGVLGVNDANNAFDSSTVTANSDGSILERLENLESLRETVIINTAKVLPQTSQSPVFTVAGGPIEILSFTGEVTTQIEAQATELSVYANPTTGSDTALCTALDLTGDVVGTFYSLKTSFATALQEATNGADEGMAYSIILPVGSIDIITGASSTGNITWRMRYRPLATGVTVTAN